MVPVPKSHVKDLHLRRRVSTFDPYHFRTPPSQTLNRPPPKQASPSLSPNAEIFTQTLRPASNPSSIVSANVPVPTGSASPGHDVSTPLSSPSSSSTSINASGTEVPSDEGGENAFPAGCINTSAAWRELHSDEETGSISIPKLSAYSYEWTRTTSEESVQDPSSNPPLHVGDLRIHVSAQDVQVWAGTQPSGSSTSFVWSPVTEHSQHPSLGTHVLTFYGEVNMPRWVKKETYRNYRWSAKSEMKRKAVCHTSFGE